MREGSLLLPVILVAVVAVVFYGWLQWAEDRRAARLRDWAGQHGWRVISPGPGQGGQPGVPMPAWAAAQDWQDPKIAVTGWHAGYEIVVAWGETLSYSGMDAVTGCALRWPGPPPGPGRPRGFLPDRPRGQVLTVHGTRLMIWRNGWAAPGDILPIADELAAIAGELVRASAAGTR